MQIPTFSIPPLPTYGQIRPFFTDLGSKISALKTSVFQNSVHTLASLDRKTIAAIAVGTCLAGVALYVLFSKRSADGPAGDGDPTRTGGDPVPGDGDPARTEGEPGGDPDPARADERAAAKQLIVTPEELIVNFIADTALPAYDKVTTFATEIIKNSRKAIVNIARDPLKASLLKGGVPIAVAALAYGLQEGGDPLLTLALAVVCLWIGTAVNYAYNNSAQIFPVLM